MSTCVSYSEVVNELAQVVKVCGCKSVIDGAVVQCRLLDCEENCLNSLPMVKYALHISDMKC